MGFRKILCPTDFSSGSRRALGIAAQLAQQHDAELVVAHIWFAPPIAYGGELVIEPTLIDEVMKGNQVGLDEAVSAATAAGAPRVTTRLATGVPWAEIVSLLDHEDFDLCVIGTHGRTGLSRVLLGSVAEKVVRHAPCAVMTARPDGGVHPFRHALVPTDFSRRAEQSFDLAREVLPADTRITLLHVVELPVPFAGVLPADFALDIDKRSAIALGKEAVREPTFQRPTVFTLSRVGNPGAQILAAIDEDPTIDLVVIGSEGRTGIKRALIGSVAEKVVRHASVPVLVSRQR